MLLLFGLLTALSFGVADFLAGLVGKKISPLTLTLYSQAIGSVIITGLALLLGGVPVFSDLAWGAAAGCVLGTGFILYYKALSAGRMGVVAAVTGVGTAIIPFSVGLLLGEQPSTIALVGIMLVILSIALVSTGNKSEPGSEKDVDENVISPSLFSRYRFQRGFLVCHRDVIQAAVAGLWLGFFFVFLGQAQTTSPLWPAASATVFSALSVAVFIPFLKPDWGFSKKIRWVIVAVGICQTLGTLTFVVAANLGMLSVAGVAGALSPVPTAILAFLVLKEQPSWVQVVGILAALSGVVMMNA
ncbi:MAG: DMT family transporter [Pseudomonadota bacterium]|uniref:DMT family transporter n=1 Tax=Methylophaga aminisulfidivorans TaxID=230105 RepID=UPI0024E1F2C0|nr:DMT family transporter [Methylophaga aminisulfidivorans]MEC9411726.1 DMT family transporter [Pseudomonadota bacterium]